MVWSTLIVVDEQDSRALDDLILNGIHRAASDGGHDEINRSNPIAGGEEIHIYTDAAVRRQRNRTRIGKAARAGAVARRPPGREVFFNFKGICIGIGSAIGEHTGIEDDSRIRPNHGLNLVRNIGEKICRQGKDSECRIDDIAARYRGGKVLNPRDHAAHERVPFQIPRKWVFEDLRPDRAQVYRLARGRGV